MFTLFFLCKVYVISGEIALKITIIIISPHFVLTLNPPKQAQNRKMHQCKNTHIGIVVYSKENKNV